MSINISSANAYLNEPCQRCGSKRRVAKTWKEKIPTFSGGFSVVEYSQIVCINKECQSAFDKLQLEEEKKREDLRAKRASNLAERKANSLKQANKTRKENQKLKKK